MTLAVAALAVVAGPAHANHSAPATYSGSAASGGTVEFDVSPDGASITRFAVNDVPTTCGTVTSQLTGNVPIVNHAFSQTSGPTRFSGSFPATQQAQGSLSVYSAYPSCTSDPVAWTATTTAPPPAAVPTGAPGPSPTSDRRLAYRSCVRKAQANFRKARKAAQKARARATGTAGKRKANRRLKRAAKRRNQAIRRCARLR